MRADDAISFFVRCRTGLAPGGLIVIKENVCSKGFIVDKVRPLALSSFGPHHFELDSSLPVYMYKDGMRPASCQTLTSACSACTLYLALLSVCVCKKDLRQMCAFILEYSTSNHGLLAWYRRMLA